MVYAKPTVQGADCVLRYLARYVHRAAITDARILRVDAMTVTFRYRDATACGLRTMTRRGEEFLRRFLQHVLPRGFHKVRDYGFWRPQAAATRAQLQHQLAPPAPPHLPERATSDGAPVASAPRCPHCGHGLVYRARRFLRASHAPAWIDPP